MSASVTAASGCAWTARSSVAWVTVIAGASGTGNGSVAFSVAANPGGVRTGTVTVAGQTFTVTQAAAAIACTYAISPTSVSMDEKQGDGTVNVSAGTGCAWTARSNANWITVTSGASGNGSGSVEFSVKKNSGDDQDRHIDDCRTHFHGQARRRATDQPPCASVSNTSSARPARGGMDPVERHSRTGVGPAVDHGGPGVPVDQPLDPDGRFRSR